jgi:hypothetical protein
MGPSLVMLHEGEACLMLLTRSEMRTVSHPPHPTLWHLLHMHALSCSSGVLSPVTLWGCVSQHGTFTCDVT